MVKRDCFNTITTTLKDQQKSSRKPHDLTVQCDHLPFVYVPFQVAHECTQALLSSATYKLGAREVLEPLSMFSILKSIIRDMYLMEQL